MAVVVLAAALLALTLAFAPRCQELSRIGRLGLPSLLFVAVIAVVALSLTPYGPGGPHPVWAYVGIQPGALTVHKSLTLLEMLSLMGLALVFGLGLAVGASDARARLAVDVLLLAGIGVAIYSFAELASGDLGPGRQRINGPLESINPMATLFGVMLLLAISRGVSRFRSGGWVAASPQIAAGLVMAMSLLATGSRGGAASVAGGLVVFATLQIVAGGVKWTRGLSNALLEAMAHGLACIANDIPPNREALADGQAGLLSPVEDVVALSDAMAALIDDRDLARRLGQSARRRVLDTYAMDRVCDDHERLYGQLLSRAV